MADNLGSVEDVVVEVLSNCTGLDTKRIKSLYVLDGMSIDSLDKVEICMTLEEEFEMSISDLEMDAWENIGDIVRTCAKGREE